MNPSDVNWLAVFVAALAGYILGAVWYNPKVFGNAWMKGLNLNEEELKKGSVAKVMTLSFVAYLVAAANLAFFLGKDPSLAFSTMAGFLTGFGWVAMFLAIFYLFENRTMKIYLINAGYAVITMTLIVFVFGFM